MKKIGTLFYRPVATLVLVVVVVILALPYQASANPATVLALASDDFNRCSLGSGWSFVSNNVQGATSKIVGQYTGESYLELVSPPDVRATFSNENQLAPRVITSIPDADFEVEVKFLGPIYSETADYKIQGLLFRDNTGSTPQWFRFDFNSNNKGLKSYLGYMDTNNVLKNIIGDPKDLPGANPMNDPVYMRVKYIKATGEWIITYQIKDTPTPPSLPVTETRSFTEASLGVNFTVTDVAIFVGSTTGSSGTNPPGHVAKVDYFSVLTSPVADDNIVLNVTKAGNGSGSVNWPMTDVSAQCSGNTVKLTATAAAGSEFAGWSGDVNTSAKTIDVVMNSSKNLIATFNTGAPIEYDYTLFLPAVHR